MTKQRRKMLEWIARFMDEFGRPPSGMEIALGLDMKPNTVYNNLKAMAHQKYVRLIQDYRGRYLVTSYRLEGESVGVLDERQVEVQA